MLALCRQLMPYNDGLSLVVIVQIIVFYLSVASLYWTLKRLDVARNIVMIVTFAYAVNPVCGHFNMSIMTESLATSFCVFLAGCFVRWIRRGRLIDILGLFLCEAFLIFLRPAFVYMLVALSIIILALVVRKEYRKVAQLTFVVVVLGGALFGYCKEIESKTGIFTPSTVSVINTYFNAGRIGKFSPEKVTDP
jgi:4-amino-4-deoxy-L-arabinose transferase-like glycosyltransferase